MVQKPTAKRGRPRAYDPDTALARAMGVFWDQGYAATSLDDISAATGMNRPSLYGAFGDKHTLYRETIERYRAGARAAMTAALAEDRPLAEGLERVYQTALSYYFPEGGTPRGCFMIGTAVTEAVRDDAVRTALAAGLVEIDRAFETRMRLARERGELPRGADPVQLARLASAVLYFLAVRSRAGDKRAALEATVRVGIALICGPPPRGRRRAADALISSSTARARASRRSGRR
ncbi:MAG TPA: TetR/AcrR family transcriptional regulator [Candidatus Sulfotelmatobacter sp.]|nr:TetR/AcrR family transcriptional regulator [Candidatus Sulfotelmatobacter sp.]